MPNQTRKNMLLEMLAKEPADVFLNYALAMEMIGTKEFKNAEAQLQKVLVLWFFHCVFLVSSMRLVQTSIRSCDLKLVHKLVFPLFVYFL